MFVTYILALIAYKRSANLPDEEDDEYVSEKYFKHIPNKGNRSTIGSAGDTDQQNGFLLKFMTKFVPESDLKKPSALSEIQMEEIQSKEDEYIGLLSEVEEISEEEVVRTNYGRNEI